MTSKRPKWESIYDCLIADDDTIAVEHLEAGGVSYFTAKTNRAVHCATFAAMMRRELLRPVASKIDPATPVAFEVAA